MNISVKLGQSPIDALGQAFVGPKPGEYQWATYLPSRTPRLKIHRVIGHAKNAIGQGYGDTHAYEVREGKWTEVTEEWAKAIRDKREKERKEREDRLNARKCPTCGQIKPYGMI